MSLAKRAARRLVRGIACAIAAPVVFWTGWILIGLLAKLTSCGAISCPAPVLSAADAEMQNRLYMAYVQLFTLSADGAELFIRLFVYLPTALCMLFGFMHGLIWEPEHE